jgi:hypothetical protein
VALTDSLIAYWDLDEASGNAIDAHGSLDLTDNNTVGAGTGIGGTGSARAFDRASAEYFSRASESAFQMGDIDFSIAAWVYLVSDVNSTILCKYDIFGAGIEWLLFYNSNDHSPNQRFSAIITPDGTTGARVTVDATTFGNPGTGSWHYVIFSYDATNNLMEIQVDDGTIDTASETGGAYASSTAPLQMGALLVSGSTEYWANARMQYVGVWKKRLSTAERTSLYNGGSGLAYASLGGGISIPVVVHHRKQQGAQ